MHDTRKMLPAGRAETRESLPDPGVNGCAVRARNHRTLQIRTPRKMSVCSPSLTAVDPSELVSPAADCSRHGLFRYLTAEESADYLAIMDLFSATLLVDLSAAEVTAQLAGRGRDTDRDTVEARCRQLVAWGNLVPAVRDARVSTVAQYIRSRSRYQVSKLGGRLHREAVAILHASDGAREVARELLGQPILPALG